ncbi:MAG: hypothetical protein AAFX87_26175 [Bacteroidota bacterium]
MKALFIILSIFVISSTACFAQEKTQWGTVHYKADIRNADPEELSFLYRDLDQFNYFCASEFHRSEAAITQYKKFITYLSLKKGLDKLVMERPYAYGYLVSQYLATGDTTILKIATDTFWSFDKFGRKDEVSHDAYGLFKWLYEFMHKNDMSIKVVGVDLNQALHGTVELAAMQYLIEKHQVQAYFKQSYQALAKLAQSEKPSFGKLKKWVTQFDSELAEGAAAVKEKLGDEYVLS